MILKRILGRRASRGLEEMDLHVHSEEEMVETADPPQISEYIKPVDWHGKWFLTLGNKEALYEVNHLYQTVDGKPVYLVLDDGGFIAWECITNGRPAPTTDEGDNDGE